MTIHQELERFVLYLLEQFNISRKSDYEIKIVEDSNKVKYEIETRIPSYMTMSHMSATDDLCSTLEYYKENLPEQFKDTVDGLYGEVGEKGYIFISVVKYL